MAQLDNSVNLYLCLKICMILDSQIPKNQNENLNHLSSDLKYQNFSMMNLYWDGKWKTF